MTIRSTLILLALPLFLALALVNGALLYVEEREEMERALDEQALAAAVTAAAFIAEMERPEEVLGAPLRARALAAASRRVEGLDGLFLTRGMKSIALVPTANGWSPRGGQSAPRALVSPVASDADGSRYIVASAPAGARTYVTARLDAEPMFAALAQARRILAAVLAIAVLTAVALGWFVGRRIARELRANRRAIAAIAAGEEPPGDATPAMREPRDLADALRLMAASRDAATARRRRVKARRASERSVATALAACRAELFAPVSQSIAGCRVVARVMGDPPAGSFFAVCGGDRVTILLGRCRADEPEDALAQAHAARRFLEAQVPRLGRDAAVALAGAAYGAEDVRWLERREGDCGTRVLAMTDCGTEHRAGAYAARNSEAAADVLLDGIEALLEPDGLFAALGPD